MVQFFFESNEAVFFACCFFRGVHLKLTFFFAEVENMIAKRVKLFSLHAAFFSEVFV